MRNVNHPYYQRKLYLPQVDNHDSIIGKIERWEAHEKGLLHRGFTAILTYKGQFLLQHRRHPAFDKCWDFTFSSHAVYVNNQLQSDTDAIYEALKREWGLTKNDLTTKPMFKGKIYYCAKDPASIYTEHEFDYVYELKLKRLPNPSNEFLYGFKILPDIAEIKKFASTHILAPWVNKIML